jgi:hypothetical protein
MSPGELVSLGLYIVQQLGVMLGVGASTMLLVAHLVSMRLPAQAGDGVVEPAEARFARVVRRVLEIGLICIVLSGAAITAMHAMAEQGDVISSPAFFFKWILIAVVSVGLLLHRPKPFSSVVWEGFVGATWYALFVLHIVAPIAHWTDLLFLYVAWLAGFMLLWVSLVRLFIARPSAAAVSKPAVPVSKPAPPPIPKVEKPAPPPPVPKPEPKVPVPPIELKPALPAVIAQALTPPPKPEPVQVTVVPVKPPPPHAAPAPIKPVMVVAVPSKPIVPQKSADDSELDLPHIYVMPRTPEDAEKHLRRAVV